MLNSSASSPNWSSKLKLNFAHVQIQGVSVAIFDAKTTTNSDSARAQLLADLTQRARASGLRVDKSALAYGQNGRLMFYGTPDLVKYLKNRGLPSWTHTLSV